MFEIKLNKIESPLVVFNYEELKEQVESKLVVYKTFKVTEDNIAEAKEMRANLNNLSKAVNDKKKDVKKTILVNYNTFENQAKELMGMIDEASNEIDKQLKVFEEERIENKKVEIQAIFDKYNKVGITIDKIYNSKWENKGSTLKAIEKEIKDRFIAIDSDINLINDYTSVPEEQQIILASYLMDLDVKHAINSYKERKQALEDYNARKQREKELEDKYITETQNKAVEEENVVPSPITHNDTETSVEHAKTNDKRYSSVFKFIDNVENMTKLKKFLDETGIHYEILEKMKVVL